jgi:PBSX family phage portal protein
MIEPATEKKAKSNKQIIRALVIGGRHRKTIKDSAFESDNTEVKVLKQQEKRGKSKQAPTDEWALYVDRIVQPPYDITFLATLVEYSTILRQCVEAMEVNIEGFGHRFDKLYTPVDMQDPKRKKEIEQEYLHLQNVFDNIGGEESLVSIRRKVRSDMEYTGNGYYEVIRKQTNEIDSLAHVPSYQVRLGKLDNEFTEYIQKKLVVDENGNRKRVEVKAYKRFRRYLQAQYGITSMGSTSGTLMVWFKEFGDPRTVDCKTGEYVSEEEMNNWCGEEGRPMPEERKANEIIHTKIYSSRSPYGMPRYIGCLPTLLGDREADEVNYVTISNNNIPAMIVAVSNGQLSEETVDRMTDFARQMEEGSNYSRFLILEAETMFEGSDSGQMRLDIRPLANTQNKDQMFQEYGKNNREILREQYRLPPIFVGRAEDYTRATAESSRRLGDEQVFRPERDEVDFTPFRKLMDEMEVLYHRFVSNGPNITDDEDLLKLLVAAEKTGGMTPRIAAAIINDIMGKDILTTFSEKMDPDVPFSLQMAEAVKNQAKPNEVGQQVTALKSEVPDMLSTLMMLRSMVLEEISKREME